MIRVDNLRKIYSDKKKGQVVAVSGLSLSVAPGEIYGLLGPNGAGKTTALRMLATLLTPTSGTATVAGLNVQANPEQVRRHIGFLAASTALYGRLTARETITYFGELNGMSREQINARLAHLAGELRMDDFLDRRVESFSTGMKQKTSIARTVVHDPDVVILDEPTLGLDVMSTRAIVDFVRKCKDRGKAVIYSTHHMHEVERLCDRIGIIHKGTLVAEGTLADLLARYQSTTLEDAFVTATGLDKEDAA